MHNMVKTLESIESPRSLAQTPAACVLFIENPPCWTGWLERQSGMVVNHMILLMQAEVERFHAGNLLLHDYFQTKVQDVTQNNSVVLVSMCFGYFECTQATAIYSTSVGESLPIRSFHVCLYSAYVR